jgi:hypothetical protein
MQDEIQAPLSVATDLFTACCGSVEGRIIEVFLPGFQGINFMFGER